MNSNNQIFRSIQMNFKNFNYKTNNLTPVLNLNNKHFSNKKNNYKNKIN